MQSLTIADIKIEAYQKEFRSPFVIQGLSMTKREGYYLTITAGSFMARGEASPLEGYSFETIKKAHHDLKRFKDGLLNQEIPLNRDEFIIFLKRMLDGCCASVRFAFETALIGIFTQNHEMDLMQFFGAQVKYQEPVGLLQGNHQQIKEQAMRLASQGVRYFKLKVGDRNIPMDVTKVRDLRAIAGVEGKIRLDANRAWQEQEALLFMQLIGPDQIQFIEEPSKNPADLLRYTQQIQIPLALDETLLTSKVDVTAPGRCMPTLVNHEAIGYYVLKPSLLGGVLVTLNWIEHAKCAGKRVVISSMFETSVAIPMLKVLSYLTDESPGFGTEDWLK